MILIKYELGRMWKEAAVAHFIIRFRHLSEGTKKKQETVRITDFGSKVEPETPEYE
jgi:hypothetical protein